ncbi:MAG: polysaccharide pyruvyl transferase family protein [Actinomycetes bacterium]
MRGVGQWPPATVMISGAVSLNGGDAAILEAAVNVVQQAWPGARIMVADPDHAAAVRYHPDLQFVPPLSTRLSATRGTERRLGRLVGALTGRLLSNAVRSGVQFPRLASLLVARYGSDLDDLRRADVILYAGGTSLTNRYSLGPKLFELETAAALDKRIVFLPQTIEYIHNGQTRQRLVRILGRSVVFCRDETTLDNVQRMGARPDVLVRAPDLALLHAQSLMSGGEHHGAVAVCVREWPHVSSEAQTRYRETIKGLVEWLIQANGTSVTFVSTCTGRPEYRHDDSLLARRILSEIRVSAKSRVTIDNTARTTRELMLRLQDFDLVVSTRLHLAILAHCAGVPCAAIDYEQKAREVFRRLGVEDWVIDYEDVDLPSLTTVVESLSRDGAARREGVQEGLNRERAELAALVDRLRAL